MSKSLPFGESLKESQDNIKASKKQNKKLIFSYPVGVYLLLRPFVRSVAH